MVTNFGSLFFIATAFVAYSIAKKQSISINGALLCGKKPASPKDTWVKLRNKKYGFDDAKEKLVNDDGTYELTLVIDRFFEMEPEFYIYTACNFVGLNLPNGCYREWKIKIPKQLVDKNQNVTRIPYNIGRYNLEKKLKHEIDNCEVTKPGVERKRTLKNHLHL